MFVLVLDVWSERITEENSWKTADHLYDHRSSHSYETTLRISSQEKECKCKGYIILQQLSHLLI